MLLRSFEGEEGFTSAEWMRRKYTALRGFEGRDLECKEQLDTQMGLRASSCRCSYVCGHKLLVSGNHNPKVLNRIGHKLEPTAQLKAT